MDIEIKLIKRLIQSYLRNQCKWKIGLCEHFFDKVKKIFLGGPLQVVLRDWLFLDLHSEILLAGSGPYMGCQGSNLVTHLQGKCPACSAITPAPLYRNFISSPSQLFYEYLCVSVYMCIYVVITMTHT